MPIDERAISARTFHAVASSGQRAPFTQWVGRCSNPGHRREAVVDAAFQAAADQRPCYARCPSVPASQLPTHNNCRPIKKPGVTYDTGFFMFPFALRPSVTSAKDAWADYSPVVRHQVLCIFVRWIYLT
jgi:hypothetical protein